MDECKPIKTPMPSNEHLDLDEGGKMVDHTLCRSMIGSFLYFTASRPDIMFSVCMCARFQANPKEAHLVPLKESLGTLSTHQALVFGIPKELDSNLLVISIWIMPVARLIEKAHPEGAIFLVDH